MEFKDVIKGRRSIRKYKEDSVPKEIIMDILNDARLAPSWKNMQCWSFVVVDDVDTKAIIAKTLPEGNPGINAVIQAPVCIVICANPEESGIEDGKDYYLADSGIAFEHIMLSAYDKGLGTCWIGWMNEDKVKAVLDIPQNIKIVGITPLGYPDQDPKPRPRKNLNEIIYHNKWEEK